MVNARLREGETDILTFLNYDRKNSGWYVCLRHLSTEYRSILSADTRLMCRPRLGRHIYRPTSNDTISMSADTRPILHRHSATTISSRYWERDYIFPTQLRRAFSGRRPFLAFNSSNIHVFFPAMFFPRHRFYIRPSLLSEVAAFGACCFWRWAKVDIKSWYNCALFLPHGWVFQF